MTENSSKVFNESEKVLCFHGPLLYEGKILHIRKDLDSTGETFYRIHYNGWSKKWDEYVPEARILKYNEENLKLQKEKHNATFAATGRKSNQRSSAGAKSSSASRRSAVVVTSAETARTASVLESSRAPASSTTPVETQEVTPSPSTVPSSLALEVSLKRRKVEVFAAVMPKLLEEKDFEIPLPEKIKRLLIDDFDQINRQKKLLILPGRHTVNSLLGDYSKYLKNKPDTPIGHMDFIDGMKSYFNAMIGKQLLYRFERQQYGGVIQTVYEEDPSQTEDSIVDMMSGIYGPVHLMRLLSKLGKSAVFTTTEKIAIVLLKKFALHLLGYVESNFDKYFVPVEDYQVSSPEYQRLALV